VVNKKLFVIAPVIIGLSLALVVSILDVVFDQAISQRLLNNQAMERQILSATVRIQLHGRIEIEDGYNAQLVNGTLSHATIVKDRYLVTHNHFGIPLSQAVQYGRYSNGGFTGVSLYSVGGETLLDQAPITAFTVAAEYAETTLLDFGVIDGQGFFARAGLRSARFTTWEQIELDQDTEVAQIDKDEQGNTTVVWTQIRDVLPDQELSLLQLENFIQLGASGGGVYIDGFHIGNNWSRIPLVDADTGEVLSGYSVVALNADSLNSTGSDAAYQ
jgi:hypothetical protein